MIVRQMLRRVQIVNPGDAPSSPASRSSVRSCWRTNDRMRAEGRPATHADVLLGITKASLSTDSFISAASFQETTRVLTEEADHGQARRAARLKENVIVGRLIPAGTGMAFHEPARPRRRWTSRAPAIACRRPRNATRPSDLDDVQ